jgi:hypothetical protein
MELPLETQTIYYGFTCMVLLDLHQTLLSLPANVDDMERWVQRFTKTLVRLQY